MSKDNEDSLFWVDQIAKKIVERERKLKRSKTLRTEMGMGASGIPHVGSAGDGIRAYVVNLALKNTGAKSEFVAFTDDQDGLRKVPIGFPAVLEKEIGKPVSMIKDPYRCHKSLGEHITSLLSDSFDKLSVKFDLRRASVEYPKGTFDSEVVEILRKAKKAGEIIKKITGQDKYLKQLPFMPICEKCGRIYTTTAYKFDAKTRKIRYRCDQGFAGKNVNTGKNIVVKGCGHEGECGIREGKLAWKVEFAARWRALQINYEAYGKDILDSVRCNDAVCKEILGWDAPMHSFYELFIERGGKKISKSGGNVFTPDMWLSYASPESMRLLFLKRLTTTRVVDLDAIPAYMDEADDLEKIYFGKIGVENEKELAHLKRLHEYVHLFSPRESRVMIPYPMLINIMKIVKDKKSVRNTLERTGHVPAGLSKKDEEDLDMRLTYAENWVKDTGKEEVVPVRLNQKQKAALKRLASNLRKKEWKEDELQYAIHEIAKKTLGTREFFRVVYMALIQNERGPRLAPFILSIGRKKVAKLLEGL
ncbi:MAG: lysine--tRNA ligase [Candidatus Aenigmatarchaeota archaeon]|nr:MAG: lysine--tRNA ligase [Candidatus Aenigmarchaeota archaeon]